MLIRSDVEINTFRKKYQDSLKQSHICNPHLSVFQAAHSMMQLSQVICECDTLRVGVTCDFSQNALWHAPSFDYLIQTKRALQNMVCVGMMKPQEQLVKQVYTWLTYGSCET